jgi:hypothetical protein
MNEERYFSKDGSPTTYFEDNGLALDKQTEVLQKWNENLESPPSLNELVLVGFPDDPNPDGRSKNGRLTKEFLSSRKIKARGSQVYVPSKTFDLTEEQKQYIAENASLMRPIDIGRTMTGDPSLTNLDLPVRAVRDYIDELKQSRGIFYEDRTVTEVEMWKPPATFSKTLSKVNKYIHIKVKEDKVTTSQKKCINALTGYLHSYRFIHQISNLSSETDKTLFESSFVRYTNDKSDLTQEEVDQYIVLSVEVVLSSNILNRTERLNGMLDTTAIDTEGRKISMGLVESIRHSQTEYNQSVTRQQKLLESLKEKRSQRLSKQIKENASILNLVQLWKDEESRLELLELAKKQKDLIRDEVRRLSSLDEVKCRIMGLTEEEAVNG